VCKENAISLQQACPTLDASKCLACGHCIRVCPTGTLKEEATGYRLLVGGKLGRHPRLGAELPGIYDDETILEVVEDCLDHYQRHCSKGERFGAILETTPLKESILLAKKKR
jgi:dissimilatory sulfite reductase (desulfoviridin) alpha/beta subunit